MNDMQDEEDGDEDWEEAFADFEEEGLGDRIVRGWSGGTHGLVVFVVWGFYSGRCV